MDNTYRGYRYHDVNEVPVGAWRIQGTIYDTPVQAKFAAAKLFCNVSSVVVKRVKAGWTLLYVPSR